MSTSPQDTAREYSESEQRQLAINLLQLDERIHKGQLVGHPPTIDLLCILHLQLFTGVRVHAGQIRRAGFGSTYLTIGPNRSVENVDVANELLDLFKKTQDAIRSFDANQNAKEYEQSAIHLAAWAHAEVIRIHPFEDGNGRSTRALLNWILVRLGLRPIAFDVVRQEYIACLNHYFHLQEIQPLVDLCIRLSSGG